MSLKSEIKSFTKFRFAALCVLTSLLSCPVSIANDNFSYFNLTGAKPIKLLNPIYLNTSQAENTAIKDTDTSIPYNLRGDFDEADYFTSSTEELPSAQSPPNINFADIPPPSEYVKKTKVAEEIYHQESLTDPDFTSERMTFAPSLGANNFFAPLEEIQEVFSAAQNPITQPSITPEIEKKTNESFIETTSLETPEVDLEGKLVSNIRILGLQTIDSEIIIATTTTQKGSLFNSELLQQDLQKIYSTGFFTDNIAIEPTLKPDGTVDLAFVLEENLIVKDVSIIGNTVISTVELLPYINPLKNRPQNLYEINSAIKKITDCYHEKGYILANVSSVDDTTDGSLSFSIQEGVIDQINISGNEKTKDYVITRNIVTQPGTVYNEEYLKKDLAKIFSTQIFDEVNREISPSTENEGAYNVTVVVKEKSTNSVALGGGIDTGLGAFGSISLREDNFLGKAQKLSLTGILGSGILLSDASIKNHMNYQAELSFFEPYFLNADNSLMAKLYYREMGSWNVPLAIEQRIGLRAGVEHKVKGNEHLSTSFSAGIEHIDLKEGDFNRISELYARNNLNISERAKQLTGGFFVNLTPGIRYSNLDDNEVPREGIIAQAQFNEAVGVTDFNHTNGRLSGAITKFFPVFKKSTFSLTAKAGIKVHGDDMPEVMAYRLGGPYTIRGFRMNGVGSGDSFLMGSAELATPIPLVDKLKWDIFKKMRITFFVDAGKVFDPTISCVLYDRPLHAITAGIGLRVYVPGVGPISVDYGLPLTNPGDYGSQNGYFTFGTGGLNMYNY